MRERDLHPSAFWTLPGNLTRSSRGCWDSSGTDTTPDWRLSQVWPGHGIHLGQPQVPTEADNILMRVALQEKRDLNLLAAEHAGLVLYCGRNIVSVLMNLVEQNIQVVKDLQWDRWACYAPGNTPWYLKPLTLGFFLSFTLYPELSLPFPFIHLLKQQVNSIPKVTTNHVLVQYQSIPNKEADD